MEVPLTLGAIGLLALIMISGPALRGFRRRRRPRPVASWQPDTRSDAERYEPYAHQLLREIGPRFGVDQDVARRQAQTDEMMRRRPM